MYGARHGAPRFGQVVQQGKEKRQIGKFDPAFVHRQNITCLGRFDQPVRIRNAFGNTFGRNQSTGIVFRDQARQVLGAQIGVDCHLFG